MINDPDNPYYDYARNAINAVEYVERHSDKVSDVIGIAQVYALLAIAEALNIRNIQQEEE